ncbi:MAG: two-component hybrid sensor and regulator [Bacteroidetes bacterium]|jgi:PAS domain S-box-containing protein|nr:two-component hybrid sensor and regulator [Bacteroidota bacterium]
MSLNNKTKKELINEINALKKELRKKNTLPSPVAIGPKKSTPGKKAKEVDPVSFENMPFGYCLFDENRVYYMNKEAVKTMRLPKNKQQHLEKLCIYDFINKEFHSRIKKMNRDIMKGKTFNGVEFKCTDSKGKVLDIECHSRSVYYQGKKLQQSFFKNISDKKTAQLELERAKNNFEEIVSKIDEVVFYYNRVEHRIEYISSQLYNLVGIKAADYIKNPKMSVGLAHPDDLPKLFKANEELNKTKKPQNFTYRMFHKKQKRYVWIEEKIFPQFDKNGHHIANLGISRDVTEQIEQKEQLRQSEEKFRLLAENASDVIFSYMFKPYPHYSYISPSMEKITGYPLKNFYKDPYFGFKITHPDDRNKPAVVETQRTLKENLDNYEDIEKAQVVRFVRKDGKTVWLETRYTQIKNGDEHIGQEGISRDITAQKEAELELEEKERTIRNLFNNLPGMAYRCLNDKHWSMQFLSDGCYELTGYKPKDLINNHNKSYSDIVHPEDRMLGKDDIYFAIKNKTVFEIEYRIVSKHNKIIWVWEKGEGIYNDKGDLLYIEGFITDITERKIFEQELNRKWQDYRNLIDTLPIGIIIHDKGNVLLSNKIARKMGGIEDSQDITKINLYNFLSRSDKSVAEEKIRAVLSGEESKPIVYPITNTKNQKLYVRISANHVFFNGKDVVQISAEDLTQEIQLEKEKERAQRAETTNIVLQREIQQRIDTERQLEHTKNYLQLLINSSLDMISANDRNGNITEINEAGLKTFGYKQEELIGKKATLLFAGTQQDPEAAKLLIKNGYFVGEVKNRRKNGEEFTSFLSASVLRNEEGEIIGTMGISRDITVQKQREKLLQERQEQIIQQSSRINAIFESSSHLVWTVDKEYRVSTYNSNFATVLKEKYKLGIKPFDKVHELISDKKERAAYLDYWKPLYDRVFNGEVIKTERLDRDKNGNELYRLIYLNPIYNNKKEIIEISCLANDITDIKKYERQIIEQSSKLKAIFENGNQLFWTVNKDRELVTFNQKYSEAIFDIYGFHPEMGKELRAAGKEKVEKNYYDFWGEKYGEVFSQKRTINFVTERKTKSAKIIYRQIFLYPIFNDRKEIIEVGGMGMDITDLKYYQEKTIEQAAKLNAIIDNSHHKIWSFNTNQEITSSNRNFDDFIESVFGVRPKIGDAMNKPPFMSVPQNNDVFSENAAKVFNGETAEFIYSIERENEEKIWLETFFAPIKDKDGNIVEISAIANDITLRRQIEDEKNRQAALIKAIFDSSSHLIFTINKNYEITSFNKNYYNHVLENHGQETYVGKSLMDGGLKNDMPRHFIEWKERHDSVISGKPSYYKNMARRPNGDQVFFETFLDPVYLPSGGIEEVSYISLDITDKYLAEEQIKSSLKEKDILLKEVHHRVKNNLQVISSILNLQSTYVRDEKTLYILRECQNRIKSMAFIHEALYQNKNFSEIPFNDYLIMLVKNLFQTYNVDHSNVKLNFDIDPVFLNLDTSIPCGLIVNELVSNSFKYAFPDNKQGFIFISLKKQKNDVCLIIKDNGVGLPNEIDFKNTESLGLQLVVTLVEQIGGNIKLDNTNGTKFEITFKQTEKNV